ncbi:MAG: geranylgeranylglyceryl/heptaprenylglyceryl phosphate synthase [Cyclobacteriaceae bacterium]|nr:geranylgeranylglyceryl/heptaprenylglyceryl phosphate synthase [Cyclobacteriaceae bacterium]
METILNTIIHRHTLGQKSIAVLIDPDKVHNSDELDTVIKIANENYVDYFFVGGSHITNSFFSNVISIIKSKSNIPVLLFPGSHLQIDDKADGIFLLSLLSGRNPEFLIGQHVVAAPILKRSELEIISTGYILIEGGATTSVEYMSNTTPIPSGKYSIASSTAMAGEMLGKQLIYMDAGSGAPNPINSKMIRSVADAISIPLIVGGGIKSKEMAVDALDSGADIIVIGNAIEKNPNLLIEVSNTIYDMNKELNIH